MILNYIIVTLTKCVMFWLQLNIKIPDMLGKQAEATLMMDRNHKAICMKIKRSPV